MRKIILIAGVAIGIICAALISYGLFTQRDAIPSQDLTLSEYPKLFVKDAVIVIGENASQIEKESAEAIAANLENLTGNKPEIINTKKNESFKYSYNLVILGTPNSNKVLEVIYNMTDAIRVTDEYPGENKGVLEILRNPWNEGKVMLLVEGSDEWGVKAGSGVLTDSEKVRELSGEVMMTEFTKEKEKNESWVIASDDDLLGEYEKSDKKFKRIEIGDMIIYEHQRVIDDAIVEGDYINYQFDKNTKELIKKRIHWRSGLPEYVTSVITKEQAESLVRGEVQFTSLYIISPDSVVFPLKPTPKNPCWVVRSIDNGNLIVTIIDAMDGKTLGYGVPPPTTGSTYPLGYT